MFHRAHLHCSGRLMRVFHLSETQRNVTQQKCCVLFTQPQTTQRCLRLLVALRKQTKILLFFSTTPDGQRRSWRTRLTNSRVTSRCVTEFWKTRITCAATTSIIQINVLCSLRPHSTSGQPGQHIVEIRNFFSRLYLWISREVAIKQLLLPRASKRSKGAK